MSKYLVFTYYEYGKTTEGPAIGFCRFIYPDNYSCGWMTTNSRNRDGNPSEKIQ